MSYDECMNTDIVTNLGPNRTQGHFNWPRLEAFFKKAEEMFQYDLGWVPTREQARDLIRAVRDIYDGPQERSVAKVIGYFENWQRFYPWVDPVLVRRAVDFHWEVWPDLTDREWSTVIDCLAAHPDPWEEEGFEVKKHPSGNGTVYIPVTPRAKRIRMLDKAARQNLSTAYNRHKKALRGKA